MSSIAYLLGKLRRRRTQACTTSRAEQRDPPLAFGEFLAAASFDPGALPLECWPGYREASERDAREHER